MEVRTLENSYKVLVLLWGEIKNKSVESGCEHVPGNIYVQVDLHPDRTECQEARSANMLLFLMKNFKRQLHKIKEFHHAMVSSRVKILRVKK